MFGDYETYRRTGLTAQGPGFAYGLFLLVLAVLPAVLFDSQPWKAIAIGNAVTHFVTGFAWTMVGTRFTRSIKDLGIFIWLLTVPLTQILIVILIITWIF